MKKVLFLLSAMFFAVAVLTGCGGSSKVDENKPIAEVNAEAAKMDLAALQKQVEAYKAAIEAKGEELKAEAAKLKDIPLTQMLGDEAKQIKENMSSIKTSVEKLTERMEAYTKALVEKK